MSLDLIRKNGKTVLFKKNQIVFMENEIGANMYIVLKGSFGVYISSFSDFPVKVADIISGNFFGEMSVIDDSLRSATIIAEEDSITIEITKDTFPLLVENDLDIADKIFRTLVKRNDAVKAKVIESGAAVPDFIKDNSMIETDNPADRIKNMHILSEQIRILNRTLTGKESEMELKGHEEAAGHVCLLPDGYMISNRYDSNDNKGFIHKKQAVCPLCFAQNEIYLPVFSRLHETDRTLDQRIIYKDFDILWYTNCICSNCSYTDTYQEFTKYRQAAMKPVYTESQFVNKENFTGYTENYNRSLDEVIMSYYLNMYCINKTTSNLLKLAKAWQKLYWIYKDNSYDLLMKEAALNTIECYSRYYDDYYETITTEMLMQINMILGEVSYDMKDFKGSIRYFTRNVEIGRFKRNEYHDQSLNMRKPSISGYRISQVILTWRQFMHMKAAKAHMFKFFTA